MTDHGFLSLCLPVHCSDGWDRTPQVISLAEILLDPFYRTFDGFQLLIQKEWIEFGHKFADRCGSAPVTDDSNERCPIFLQWIDCVHQIVKQYPSEFQFNLQLLVSVFFRSFFSLIVLLLSNFHQNNISTHTRNLTMKLPLHSFIVIPVDHSSLDKQIIFTNAKFHRITCFVSSVYLIINPFFLHFTVFFSHDSFVFLNLVD